MKLVSKSLSVFLFLMLPIAVCQAQEGEAKSESAGTEVAKSQTQEETDKQESKEEAAESEEAAKDLLSLKIRKMLLDGELRDAAEFLNQQVADDDNELDMEEVRRSFAMIIAAFGRTRNTREAYKSMKQMLDWQIGKMESGADGVRLSGTVRSMAAMAQRIGKGEEVGGILDRALTATEARNADLDLTDTENTEAVIDLSNLRSLRAQQLIRLDDKEAAMQIMNTEYESMKELYESDTENEMVFGVYLRSLTNRMRLSEDDAAGEEMYTEHQTLLRARLDEKPDNLSYGAQLLMGMIFKAGKVLNEDPEQTMKIVNEAEKVMAELASNNDKSEQALQAVKRQLAMLTRRAEGQMVVDGLIGKPVPDMDAEFWVNLGDGDKEMTSADLEGKVVLLDFWAVWCGPCIRTFPKLKDWHSAYHDQGFEIVGVTRHFGFGWDEDTKKPVREEGIDAESENEAIGAFMKSHELPYGTLVTPNDTSMNKNFGVTGIPHVVLIDKKGNIRLIKVGAKEENAKEIEAMIEKLLAE